VIVPDFQLSLAIGKEGQNARLAARLSGWRVDIKSETQLAEEEAYANQDWAEGEWVTNAAGEQVWQPADGSEALSAEAWAEATEQIEADADAAAAAGDGEGAADESISVDPDASGDESAVADEAAAEADVTDAVEGDEPDADTPETPEAAIAEGTVEEPAADADADADEPAADADEAPGEEPEEQA